MQQVLSNLISNAIKFTETGEVLVSINCNSDTVKSIAQLHFSVTDSGIGIDPNLHKKLFKAFIQVDGSTTRKYGGTGLGLTICRRIVDLMGGKIHVESQPGNGSTFLFTVGFSVLENHSIPQPNIESNTHIIESSSASAKNLKILIVEDYADNRDIVTFMLEELGYQAEAVGDGQQALDKLAESD